MYFALGLCSVYAEQLKEEFVAAAVVSRSLVSSNKIISSFTQFPFQCSYYLEYIQLFRVQEDPSLCNLRGVRGCHSFHKGCQGLSQFS